MSPEIEAGSGQSPPSNGSGFADMFPVEFVRECEAKEIEAASTSVRALFDPERKARA